MPRETMDPSHHQLNGETGPTWSDISIYKATFILQVNVAQFLFAHFAHFFSHDSYTQTISSFVPLPYVVLNPIQVTLQGEFMRLLRHSRATFDTFLRSWEWLQRLNIPEVVAKGSQWKDSDVSEPKYYSDSSYKQTRGLISKTLLFFSHPPLCFYIYRLADIPTQKFDSQICL